MARKVHLRIWNSAAFLKRTWDDGAAYCDRLGGELLVIETSEENEFIYGILKNQTKTWAWLGCSDRSTEGTWLCYAAASDLPFENWATGQPNNANGNDHCLAFHNTDGMWSDSKCDAQLVHTVCETTSIQEDEGVTPSSSATPMACYTLGSDGRLRV
ncbi:perlucin-like [Patiria miniata]|uniref:C-type lectin domain-containing protein n=1 Tax=Patiria miniata TaxID=46514 RepID=A0A913ZIW6_PATMI|nr:perlucin-like [Patiria miniata]